MARALPATSSSRVGRRRRPGALLASLTFRPLAMVCLRRQTSTGANGMPITAIVEPLTNQTRAFYRDAITRLNEARAPYLIGGAYALAHYTGIQRHTKDLDLFVRPRDYDAVMALLAASGC